MGHQQTLRVFVEGASFAVGTIAETPVLIDPLPAGG
jgi:hypothetical protein